MADDVGGMNEDATAHGHHSLHRDAAASTPEAGTAFTDARERMRRFLHSLT